MHSFCIAPSNQMFYTFFAQIFSTILINITPAGSPPLNLCGSSKIKDKDWIKHRSRPSNIGAKEMCESEVKFSFVYCWYLWMFEIPLQEEISSMSFEAIDIRWT